MSFYVYKRYTSKSQSADMEKVEQSSRPEVSQISPSRQEDEFYEEQFHPTANFDIFGKGELFKKKINDADDLFDGEDDAPR